MQGHKLGRSTSRSYSAAVYDALFLALAEEAVMVVVTADDKLLRILLGMPHSRLAHPLAGLDSLISGTG